MNRILYITYVDYCKKAYPGVEAKIADQILAMREAGYYVDRVNQFDTAAQLVDCNDNSIETYKALIRRFSIYKTVKFAVKKRDYVCAYIRFQFFSEDVHQIVSLLHRRKTKVIIEFPTYPYEGELHQQGIKGEIKLICDKLYRNVCRKYIDTFVTCSEDEKIYGVPCIHVLNGMDYSSHPLRNIRPAKENELHLLAVASMLPWHGYDRLLNGLAYYYRGGSSKPVANIVLHLVGDGKEIPKYKEIVATKHLDQHVMFYGMQKGEALRKIVSDCDIAVGSLAAFRIGLKKISTLKSREYCAWGFPTINATETDILNMDDPFCLFVPEDESPVDIEKVVAFYKRVYFEYGLTPDRIAERIRLTGVACSDVRAVFRPIVDYIASCSKR